VDGDLHPFLSTLCMFDHVYIGNNEYSFDAEEYTPEYGPQSATGGVGFTVRPKQELLRKVVCEPVGAGCDPDDDPICPELNANITQRLTGGDYYADVVILSELGFVPGNQIEWTVDGVAQTPVAYAGPGSYELGPIASDVEVTVTIANRDNEDCPFTETFDVPSTCGGAPFFTYGPLVECGGADFNVAFTVESSSDFTIYDSSDPNGGTVVQINVDGTGWIPDTTVEVGDIVTTTSAPFGSTLEVRLVDPETGCVYDLGPFDDTPCTS
jgi:hypothetical protein